MDNQKKLPSRGRSIGPIAQERDELRRVVAQQKQRIAFLQEQLSIVDIRDKALGHAISMYPNIIHDVPHTFTLSRMAKVYQGFLLNGFDHKDEEE